MQSFTTVLHGTTQALQKFTDTLNNNVAPEASSRAGGRIGGSRPARSADVTPTGTPRWFRRIAGKVGGRKGARFARGVGGRAMAAGLARTGQLLAHGFPMRAAVQGGLTTGLMAAGPAAVAIGGMTMALLKVVPALNDMAASAREANKAFTYASAQMAFVENQAKFQQRMLDREKGDRLSESARAIAESEQDVLQSRKEIDILVADTKNWFGALWNNIKADLYKPFNEIAGGVNRIVGNTNPNKGKAATADEWIKDVKKRDDAWLERERRRINEGRQQ